MFLTKGGGHTCEDEIFSYYCFFSPMKIPWTEEPGRLQSMGSLRVGHDWATSFTFHLPAFKKEMATLSSVLAWRIPGTVEPGGLPSMGSHRVRHDWSDLVAVAVAAAAALIYFSQMFSSLHVLTSHLHVFDETAIQICPFFTWVCLFIIKL